MPPKATSSRPRSPSATPRPSPSGCDDRPAGRSRPAAQLNAPLPSTPEQCASDAETGGFDRLAMDDWTVKPKSGFCLITDQGNVVRPEITRFVGGGPDLIWDPPERIEFAATMWQAS